MNNRLKVGILLILIGIGMPLVLFFFQDNGTMFTIKRISGGSVESPPEEKVYELRNRLSDLTVEVDPKLGVGNWILTPPKVGEKMDEIEDLFKAGKWNISTTTNIDISFRKIVGVGVLIILLGIGFIIYFSPFPHKSKGRTS